MTDSQDLHLNIDYFGSNGIILSPEQKACLQTSLSILKANQKFSRVYFWGKILGVRDDYFIAQGVGPNEFGMSRTLYSTDCVSWKQLLPATPDMKERSKLAKGRFTGDPSYEFEHIEVRKFGEGEEQTEEEEVIAIKEEERLASVISEIDRDARIVPRGTYVKTPTGQVYESRTFEGLTITEAAKLCNYMHFREPEKLHEKSLLQKANLDKSIDFMDSVDDDIPKGSWSMQFERGSALITLRSLLWVGYVLYHIPATKRYGSIYVGTGEKNLDLPFML